MFASPLFWFTATGVVLAVATVVWRRRIRARGVSPSRALVLLLEAPRILTEDAVRAAAERAFGIELDPEDEHVNGFVEPMFEVPVVGGEPATVTSFFVHARGVTLQIQFQARPYFDPVEEYAAQLQDDRLTDALRRNRAWLSVDRFPLGGEATSEEVLRPVARMLAELAGGDCLALYSAELGRLVVYRPELLGVLRSDEPMAAFSGPSLSPVLTVLPDDPDMQEAVANARLLWGEFEAAFRARGADEGPFLVKAPFCDGESTEFMWIQVTAIDGDRIYGILENEPFQVLGFIEGQEVEVPQSDLADLLFCVGDEVKGGYTAEVLDQRLQP